MKNLSIFFKDTKPFGQLIGLLFILVVCFVIATSLQMLVNVNVDSPTEIRMNILVTGLVQVVTFFGAALLFAMLYHGKAIKYLKICGSRNKWGLGLLAIMITLLLLPLVDQLTIWNEGIHFGTMEEKLRSLAEMNQKAVEKMFSLTTTGDFLLQLLVVALVPAVCEEAFFRGALQQVLHGCLKNAHVAIFVTALIFSLAHGDLYGFVPRFFLGMMLGYLFWMSGSLLVNICAHFFNNALVVLMYYLHHRGVVLFDPSEPFGFPAWLVTICAMAAAGLFYLYFVKRSVNISK